MLTENKLLKRQEIESKKKITSYGQKSKDPAKDSGTLKADVNCNNEKIIFQTKLKEAEATLQKKCEQLQNKNEELESLSHELIEGRERLNTKTKECDELKSKLEKNRMELDELRNRWVSITFKNSTFKDSSSSKLILYSVAVKAEKATVTELSAKIVRLLLNYVS